MRIIDGIEMSDEDADLYEEYMDKYAYYDRLQYVYKIKLNSSYGALTNYHFRFFDLRLGESTTATGRAILKHQVRKIGEVLDGSYDFDPPVDEASFAANNNKFPSESIIYGDTDSVAPDTKIDIDGVTDTIENHFDTLSAHYMVSRPKENVELLMLMGTADAPCIADEGWDYAPINVLYRHKTNKKRYRITLDSGETVTVTEDHSLVVVDETGTLLDRKPTEVQVGDTVIRQR